MNLRELTVEQYLAWERDGFLVLDNFLSADEVTQYNNLMDDALGIWRSTGLDRKQQAHMNNVVQISRFIEFGEPYLQLMEHPRMMNIMRDVYGDSFVMIDNDIFIKSPGQLAHTSWHRDTETTMTVNDKRTPFMVKVFYFTSDVPYDGGCLAFLPGSHKMSNDQLPKVDVAEDMPGHVRMNVKAGTAVLFNGSTYHSALSNTSEQTRKSYIFNYGPLFLRTWPGFEPSEQLIASQAGNPLRRMLLGAAPWTEDPKAFND